MFIGITHSSHQRKGTVDDSPPFDVPHIPHALACDICFFLICHCTGPKTGQCRRRVKEILEKIKGSENKSAKEVFKNLQLLGEMPAGRVLRVMQFGYSNSLGVSCDHCHVVDQWEKDDKAQKRAAREMIKMLQTINTELLPKNKNLKNEKPIINCTTCHRGQIVPALNLPKPEIK